MKTMKEYYTHIAKFNLTDKYATSFLKIGLLINIPLIILPFLIGYDIRQSLGELGTWLIVMPITCISAVLSLDTVGSLFEDNNYTVIGNFLLKRKMNSKKFNEELKDQVEKHTPPFEINDTIVMKPEFIDFEEESKKYKIVDVKENNDDEDYQDYTFLLKEVGGNGYEKVNLWALFYNFQKVN